jgi:Domain of unknown function (DUF4336)
VVLDYIDEAPTMLTELDAGVFAAREILPLPGMKFPIRMGVVRLATGDLWVHSPIRCTPALSAEVAALGRVRFLVAPSHLHHLFIGDWAGRFSDATLWAAEDLQHKRADLRIDGIHGKGDEPWKAEIETIVIAGAPKFRESVFFHRSTRTLFVTDLLFNLGAVGGWIAPIALRLMGVHHRLAQSRAWRFAAKDRAAFAESGRRIVELGAKRLVVAHGEVIDDLPAGALEHALSWMLAGGTRAIAAAV